MYLLGQKRSKRVAAVYATGLWQFNSFTGAQSVTPVSSFPSGAFHLYLLTKTFQRLYYDSLWSFSLFQSMNVYEVCGESVLNVWAFSALFRTNSAWQQHDQSVASICINLCWRKQNYGNASLTFGHGILVPCAVTTEVMLAHSYTYSTWPLIVTWVTSELVSQPGGLPATSVLSKPSVDRHTIRPL